MLHTTTHQPPTRNAPQARESGRAQHGRVHHRKAQSKQGDEMKKIHEAFERWMNARVFLSKTERKFGVEFSQNDVMVIHRAASFYAGWMAAKRDGKNVSRETN